MSKACRQHYKLATGEGLNPAPKGKPTAGFAKGGPVRKNAGGALYRKGGKARSKY